VLDFKGNATVTEKNWKGSKYYRERKRGRGYYHSFMSAREKTPVWGYISQLLSCTFFFFFFFSL
jgi:hypothetical protein